MAEYVLSYPFSIDTSNGRAAVVYSSTDVYKAQQIKSFMRTDTSERRMFPTFGITDPTFDDFNSGTFYDSFSNFYDSGDIKLEEIEVVEEGGAVVDVIVDFS